MSYRKLEIVTVSVKTALVCDECNQQMEMSYYTITPELDREYRQAVHLCCSPCLQRFVKQWAVRFQEGSSARAMFPDVE